MPSPCPTCHPPLLDVQHLSVTFDMEHGTVRAVDDVNWQLQAGECLAIVGESGSGKSISALSIMGLLPKTAHISGQVLLDGRDILQLPEAQRRQLRGKDISMVFQDPLSALNPVHRVGDQIAEAIRSHQTVSQQVALAQAVELLHEVGIPNPQQRARDYPHQFSGGMRQRVVIAMALANNPRILIADEPTTALDVTVQAQIMELLARLREKRNTALVLITHDLAVVAGNASRVLVMHAGRVVETAPVDDLFHNPQHSYTQGLLNAIIRIDSPRQKRLCTTFEPKTSAAHTTPADRLQTATPTHAHTAIAANSDSDHSANARSPQAVSEHSRCNCPCYTPHSQVVAASSNVVLSVENLCKTFHTSKTLLLWRRKHALHAVRNVNLQVHTGETLGIVGESGCGKSTLSRCILRLHEPNSGAVHFCGQDVLHMDHCALCRTRQNMQMVFQDPYGCLDPRYTVRELLTEPYAIHGLEVGNNVEELLDRVGLLPEHAGRYPHEFSGGQLQRIVIARAIALKPQLIICDEPVSALDVSIRGQIINLLSDLQDELGMSYLFIAHDLSVVRHIADRVAVMYRGQIVETAEVEALFANPQHPYTQTLLAAVPVPDPAVERNRKRHLPEHTAPTCPPAAVPDTADAALDHSELLPIHPGSSHLVRRPVAT